jgi:hypothetical protein
MKPVMIFALMLTPVLISPIAQAQSTNLTTPTNSTFEMRAKEIEALSRAKNIARQAAEIANGGLLKYRAELSMHGFAAKSPYKDQGDHWMFTFRGSAPGSTDMSIESEVRVNKSDFQTTMLYNGAIRQAKQ